MKTKSFSLIVILFFVFSTSFAQQNAELKGDTVYVTTEGPVELKFPADIFQARLVDPTSPYSIVSVGHSVQLSAKSETNRPAIALVDEGKRTHSLILVYKKNLNIEKLDVAFFNYPTIKDLQQKAKQLEDQKGKAASVYQTAAQPEKETSIIRTAANTSSDNSKGGYYALIEDGDKALKSNQYASAQEKYQAVLKIQPDNDYAKKRLSDVTIKIAEKERLEKQAMADKVNELKSAANKAFYSKQYEQATEGYNKVLALQPSDVYSKSQIAVIEKLKSDTEAKVKLEKERLARQEVDNKINAMKTDASKAINEKRYDDAIKKYNDVLAINADDVLAKSKIEAITKIKQQEELKSRQEKENKNKEETFKTIVENADKAFQNKDYDVAKAGYQAAKDLKPSDGNLDKKIKSATEKITEKENEEEYKNAIAAGDEAKKLQDYEKAKVEYGRASKLFKDRNYAQDQITAIDKSVNEATAKLNGEKEKQKGELEANKIYSAAIEKADKELQAKDFVNAKLSYAAALKAKPSEAYPQDKLAEIAGILENLEKVKKAKAENDLLAAEIEKKYSTSMTKGKAAFDKKDYDVAKVEFAHAAELKPSEAEPKSRLELIEKKLSGVDVDSKYDTAIARGNVALADKNYSLALENYKRAQKIKPLESLALNQVKFVQDIMKQQASEQVDQQKKAEVRVKEEIRRKRFDDGMTAYAQYETAAQIADYDGQLLNLKQFLNLIPDVSELNTNQFNAGGKIDFAKKKIQAIRDYLTRTRGATFQLEPIPYLDQDIEKKYESFSFTSPPEDQKYTATDSANYNENIRYSKDLLLEKSKSLVADSATSITLSSLGIKFKGDKAFFKFLIHNTDANEFLTGAMQLNATKKDGSIIKNFPTYVSSFPIVLPGKEFAVVYVAKKLELKDDDKLLFTLTDRTKKKKIDLIIPGSIYNKEKSGK